MKNKLLLALGAILLLAGCTVGDNRGLLVITNLSDKKIENIKLGETVVVHSLEPGAKFDYWYFQDIGGAITADGVELVLAKYLVEDEINSVTFTILKDNPTCTFKGGYEYHLDIQKMSGEYRLNVNTGFSPSGSGPAELHYPAN